MKYTLHRLAPVETFEEFIERHDLDLHVHEIRGGVFWAVFKGVEVKDGKFLSSESGRGSTPEEAIANYQRNLAGKLLVKNACQDTRQEFRAPIEWKEQG